MIVLLVYILFGFHPFVNCSLLPQQLNSPSYGSSNNNDLHQAPINIALFKNLDTGISTLHAAQNRGGRKFWQIAT